MKRGKCIFKVILLVVAVMSIATCSVYAMFSDVLPTAGYYLAVDKVSSLNIINGDENGLFRPNSYITREQFAKIIVKASGFDSLANAAKGQTVFLDVSADRWSSGYINVACAKGILKGDIFKNFNPDDDVTLGQACTIFVKALGYTDKDVPGLWPQNYVDKARSLGLVDDIKISNDDSMPRWAAACMIDKYWLESVKQNKLSVLNNNIANLIMDGIVLGDKTTSDTITDKQVLTDKGIVYIYDKNLKYELGKKYKVSMYGDAAVSIYSEAARVDTIYVDGITGTKIKYLDGQIIKTLTLPEKTTYYYNGQKQSYANLENVIYKGTKIMLGCNYEGTGYEYAVIFDPILHSSGKYVEAEILGNSVTMDKLSEDQILTDRGIYYIGDLKEKLEIGNKYGLVVDEDTIKKVGKITKTVFNVCVKNILDTKITYNVGETENSMFLPDKTVYYYNGTKQTYDSLKSLIQTDTLIAFAKNDNNIGYEYAVVVDPIYSKPEIVMGSVGANNKIGSIDLSRGLSIVRDGKLVTPSDIEDKDVVYTVQDLLGLNPYILVVNNKIGGDITDIAPNKAAPKTLEIEKTVYQLDKDMNIDKINNTVGSFNVDDKVTAVLGHDGRVVDVFKYDGKCNPYVEYEIIANSTTVDTIEDNRIITNKGTFYLGDKSMKLEVGNKYKLVVSDDTIVKVGDSLKTVTYISVSSILQDTLSYRFKGSSEVYNMILPEDTIYFYGGTTQTYANIKSTLSSNMSILFANYDNGSGYEYGVVVDPQYSKPEVVPADFDFRTTSKIGDIELSGQVIIKNGGYINTDGDSVSRSGDYISASDLERNNVIYKVTDLWGENSYVMVIDNQVLGTIKDILPNKLSPKKIKVNSTTYEFSKDMDMSILVNRMSIFRTDSNVILLLGRDGKVVDIKWTW